MLGLVKTALHKPYTFIVLAIFICIIGPLAAVRTPTDVFPDIGIPVVAVVWQYTGLPPDQMAGRVTSPFERVLTTTVNDVEQMVVYASPTGQVTRVKDIATVKREYAEPTSYVTNNGKKCIVR